MPIIPETFPHHHFFRYRPLRASHRPVILTSGTRAHSGGVCIVESTPDASSFAYDDLAPVDADWLRQAAASLRLRLRNTVKDMLDLGSVLTKAKRRLESRWRLWLRDEAQISPRSAARLLAVDQVFGRVPPTVLEKFTPTALYNLSEPGVPQSLREYCVQQATDGDQITAKVVDEWLGAYRECPTKVPLKLAQPDAPLNVDPDEVHAGENWMLLQRLLGNDGSLHLSIITDADPQIADLIVHGVFTKPGTNHEPAIRRTATHNNLERVLLTLCGIVRTKECLKCHETKALDEYSARKDMEGGRNRYCLACERKRVREYERKKRREAKETAEPAAA
jgi:hypothetical protein